MRGATIQGMPPRFAFLILFPIVSVAALPVHGGEPAGQPTSQEAEVDPAKLQEAEYQQSQDEARFYPTKNITNLSEVIRFQLDKQNLVILTTLEPSPKEFRLIVDGQQRSVTTATAEGDNTQGVAYRPSSFKYRQFDFSDPAVLLTNREVLALPGQLNITRVSESGQRFENVQLIQSGQYLLVDDSDGDKVKLFIQVTSEPPQPTDVNLQLSARDFVTLRQKYPKETSLYLEPIFRELGQSAIFFQVDPRTAWQVLSKSYEAPADVKQQVADLVKQLDADEPRERAEASKALETLGQPAALALMHQDRAGLSEEQTSRIDTFLAGFKPIDDEEAVRLSNDPEFLALTLAADDPTLRELAFDALKKSTDRPIEFDLNADAPARLEAALKLRAELAPAATQPAATQPASQPELPPDLRDAAP